MQRSEHYATARDGTRIHWTSSGAGPAGLPPLVLCDGLGCAGYIWRFLAPELARLRRVIHWNYRGHGKSERPADPARVSLGECVDDLLAVLDAAGEPSAVLVGHSMGVQVALQAHASTPERVAGLVLVCGAPGRPLDTFHDVPLLAAAFPYARQLVERFPAAASRLFSAVVPTELALRLALAFEVDAKHVAREDLVRYLADLADVDTALFVRLLGSAAQHDASEHLPRVAVPTLILAGRRTLHPDVAAEDAPSPQRAAGAPGGTHGAAGAAICAPCGGILATTSPSRPRPAPGTSGEPSLAGPGRCALPGGSPRPGGGPGGLRPAYRWRTVVTPHFELHFHQGEERLAARVAEAAEAAHARLAPLLGDAPLAHSPGPSDDQTTPTARPPPCRATSSGSTACLRPPPRSCRTPGTGWCSWWSTSTCTCCSWTTWAGSRRV
jgi:pimeloyl-ACP methyl ester carboxylesterase